MAEDTGTWNIIIKGRNGKEESQAFELKVNSVKQRSTSTTVLVTIPHTTLEIYGSGNYGPPELVHSPTPVTVSPDSVTVLSGSDSNPTEKVVGKGVPTYVAPGEDGPALPNTRLGDNGTESSFDLTTTVATCAAGVAVIMVSAVIVIFVIRRKRRQHLNSFVRSRTFSQSDGSVLGNTMLFRTFSSNA